MRRCFFIRRVYADKEFTLAKTGAIRKIVILMLILLMKMGMEILMDARIQATG